MANIINKNIGKEKNKIYVPLATNNTPGIASFKKEDFFVNPDGKVSLTESIVNVKESLNELESSVNINKQDILDNATKIIINEKNIARNREDLQNVYLLLEQGEIYIGNIPNRLTEPTDEELNTFVKEIVGGAPENGYVVLCTVDDIQYRYVYSKNGWIGKQDIKIAPAELNILGTIKGGRADSAKVYAQIENGIIIDIFIMNRVNDMISIFDAINTNTDEISGMKNGNIIVNSADNDGNGNNIVKTYARKDEVYNKEESDKNYMPYDFVKVSYLTTTQYVDEVPESSDPIFTSIIDLSQVPLNIKLFCVNKILNSGNINKDTIYNSIVWLDPTETGILILQHTLSVGNNILRKEQRTIKVFKNKIQSIMFTGNMVDLLEPIHITTGTLLNQDITVIGFIPDTSIPSVTVNVYSNRLYPSTLRFSGTHVTSDNSIWTYDSFNNFPEIGIKDRIYIAKDTNLQYRWKSEESKYVQLGFIVDLNNYYTKEEVNNELSKKPDDEKISSLANKLRFNQLFDIKTSTLPSKNGLIVTNIYGGHHIAGITDSQYYHKMYDIDTIIGHLYYFAPNFSDKKGVYILGHIDSTKFSTKDGKIFEGGNKFDIYIQIEKNNTIDLNVKPILIDLTEMFGTGNEPTIDNIYTYIDNNVYYPYFVNACEDMIFSTERKDNANQLANINVDGTNWGFDYKQDKTDNALETTNKTVVGGINELQENKANLTDFKYNFEQLISIDSLPKITDSEYKNNNDGSFTIQYETYIKDWLVMPLEKNIVMNPAHTYYFNFNIKGSDTKDFLNYYLQKENTSGLSRFSTAGIHTGFISLNKFQLYENGLQNNINITCSPIVIDLTQMFGAGNEPSTVEEVQKYLIPNKYYPYGRNVEPSIYATIEDFRYSFRQMLPINSTSSAANIVNNLDGSFSVNHNYTLQSSFQLNYSISLISAHKYYFHPNFVGERPSVPTFYFYTDTLSYQISDAGAIFTNSSVFAHLALVIRVGTYNGSFSPILIDLTDMFGAGKEPTTKAEVRQYLVAGKYYPYGRNIEPRMYCTKAEVNSLSMCPSDTFTLDIVDKPTLWTTDSQNFIAPDNGYLICQLNRDGRIVFSIKLDNKFPILYNEYNQGGADTYILPVSKGQNFTLRFVVGKDQLQAGARFNFVYAKEITL